MNKKKKFIKKQVSNKQAKQELVPKAPSKIITVLRMYLQDLLLLLIPLSLFLIFLAIYVINAQIEKEIAKQQLAPFPMETQMNPYPFVQEMPLLPLSAQSAIITDKDSQVVLFAKNSELRFSMASTVKIMTALTALDYYEKDSVLTVQTGNVEGSVLQLQVGDQFYFQDLLYAMLLPSANDAALVIADNYPGGREAFVAKMNEKAQSWHLNNTHFSDPTGLEDDGDYTTVTDLARLASMAIDNKTFAAVTSTKEKIITNVSGTRQYQIQNLNKLLGTNGVTGIKTGTTEGAGEVLVTSVVANGHTFIVVVMKSEDRFADTGTLLNFIAQKVQFINPNDIDR
ncbi:MAG TPA: serine hydrolase [Patescibacteria group bacterium]|nr:serine hydrolase [Patescibacteria group bacterium]